MVNETQHTISQQNQCQRDFMQAKQCSIHLQPRINNLANSFTVQWQRKTRK
jgi:hypothetical protein